MSICPDHGVERVKSGTQMKCPEHRRQWRRASEKGKAWRRRNSHSVAGKASNERYARSEGRRLGKLIWENEKSLRELETKYAELVGGSHD